jgi:hypothetical protein
MEHALPGNLLDPEVVLELWCCAIPELCLGDVMIWSDSTALKCLAGGKVYRYEPYALRHKVSGRYGIWFLDRFMCIIFFRGLVVLTRRNLQ